MKTKKLLIAGLAGIVLAACTEDITLDGHSLTKDSKPLRIEVTDELAVTATRADYSGFPATAFEEGDAVGVYAFDGTSYTARNIRFVRQSDGSWEPDENIPYDEGDTYYAYFPYSSTAYTPSTAGTADDVDTKFAPFISDASSYFWKADQSAKSDFTYSNLMIAKGVVTSVINDEATIKFVMEHKRGLAVFYGEDATEVIFTGNIPYQTDNTVQFLMKPSTSTSFTYGLGTYNMEAPSGDYITKYIMIPGTDLSKVDNSGYFREARSTANCYLIHEAGDYKIPLVYGNGIKDGSVNTVAFYPGPNVVYSGYYNASNHKGNGITGPWITKSGSGINAGMGLTAASAELLWQDVSGLVTAVSVTGNFLRFTVGTFSPGNAVIAVKDGSGNIMWSWHIWATEDDLSNTTVVSTGDYDYIVAPVNLGWVPTGGDGKQGYCPYYQWGRKDPFIPAAAYDSTSDHAVYNINNASVTGITYTVSTTATIADNIKNPTTFYYNSSTLGPATTTHMNMWDPSGHNTSTKKTIYDPCPPGFHVPSKGLYVYMSNNEANRPIINADLTNKGFTWDIGITGDALWFPAAGTRGRLDGHISEKTSGYYYSIEAAGSSGGRMLSFGTNMDSNIQYWSNYRSTGTTIRPVAEE